MVDFRVEQTYGEIERMVHEEVVYRLLSGPPEEAHLQPTKEEQEWAERVANEVTQGVMSQMDEAEGLAERLEGTEQEERKRRIMAEAALEEASALIKTLKSGTEPLTDEEIRALLVCSGGSPDHPLFDVTVAEMKRLCESARAKLRARLAKRDEE